MDIRKSAGSAVDTKLDRALKSVSEGGSELRKRTVGVTVTLCAAFIAILSFSAYEILRSQGEVQQIVSEIRLGQSFKENSAVRTERRLDVDEILRHVPGDRQQQAVRLAIELYDRKIPYAWGGKSPASGFDSSGFVAYILDHVGVLHHPETYWSGKLKRSLKSIPPSQKQPGDILFYEGGPCMIYLGKGLSIGALPGGVATGNLDTDYSLIGVGRY